MCKCIIIIIISIEDMFLRRILGHQTLQQELDNILDLFSFQDEIIFPRIPLFEI